MRVRFLKAREIEFEIRNSISYLSNSQNPQDNYIAGLKFASQGDIDGIMRMADKLNFAGDYVEESYLREVIIQARREKK